MSTPEPKELACAGQLEPLERLEALAEAGPERLRLETELRRAVAAHRYVVRHLVSEPLSPAAAEAEAPETVRLLCPVSGSAAEDFLFPRGPAGASRPSRVAWLRGEEKGLG